MNLEQKKTMESQALDRCRADLTRAGIRSDLVPRTNTTRAMLGGKYHGEPFAVYASFLGHGNAAVAIVVTRYKGVDWWNMEPARILKREG